MAKLFAICFVGLMLAVHAGGRQAAEIYHRPLSMFRDCDPQWIGYLLFGLLLGVGLSTARTAYRARSSLDLLFYVLMTGILSVIAFTKSVGFWHNMCAVFLMGSLFVYYGFRLFFSDNFLLWCAHLVSPPVICFGMKADSYGIWQKSMIVYFLVIIVVHEAIMASSIASERLQLRRVGEPRRKVQVVIARKAA